MLNWLFNFFKRKSIKPPWKAKILEIDENNLITKVKRLSDNIIFSQGDVIKIEEGRNSLICTLDYFLMGEKKKSKIGDPTVVLRYYEWRTTSIQFINKTV